jgi:hypothetical protein
MDEAPLEDKAAMTRAKISKVAKANNYYIIRQLTPFFS